MALFMGALMIHGIQPGPLFIANYPELFWGFIASMYVGNAMLLVLNLPLIGIWVRVLKTPYVILFPLILLFCLIGVYSLNANIVEIIDHARLRHRRLFHAPRSVSKARRSSSPWCSARSWKRRCASHC